MIDRVAEALKLQLIGLPFVGKLGGMVQVLERKEGETTERFPAIYGLPVSLCESTGDYTDMIPDDRYPTIIYFEPMGTIPGKNRAGFSQWISTVRLVCWINAVKLGKHDPSLLAANIIPLLKSLPNKFEFLTNFQTEIVALHHSGANLFSKYSYKETRRQYLMYPFSAFAVDIRVKYFLPQYCTPNFFTEMPDPPLVDCGGSTAPPYVEPETPPVNNCSPCIYLPLDIKTADYTATLEDHDRTIPVDASSGPVTITLPAAGTVENKLFRPIKIDSSSNEVIIVQEGNAINYALPRLFFNQNEGASFQSNGSQYIIRP